MDPKSRQQMKMAERGTRPSIRRCCLSHVAQHTTRALARIVEVYQGKDGHVRVAKVQVGKSQLTRARLHKTPVTTKGIRTCTRNLSELH